VDARGGFDERFASWKMTSIEFSQAGTVLRSVLGFFGAGFGVGDTCGNSIRPVLDAQSAIKHSTRRSRIGFQHCQLSIVNCPLEVAPMGGLIHGHGFDGRVDARGGSMNGRMHGNDLDGREKSFASGSIVKGFASASSGVFSGHLVSCPVEAMGYLAN
jgi:hypothetical protein